MPENKGERGIVAVSAVVAEATKECADCGRVMPKARFIRCYMRHRHGWGCDKQEVDVCVACERAAERSGQYA